MGRQKWSKEKVIAELQRVRADGPVMDTSLDAAAKRYFGSVRSALEIAGLPCGKREPPYFEWTKESVIEAIRNRGLEGRNLDSIHRDEPSLYAAGKRFLGTWIEARKQAGFPKEASEFYSADEVQMRMIELYEKGLPLIYKSHRDPKLVRSAKKHFKSWRNAAKLLGLESEVRRKWTDQGVIEAIQHRRASGDDLFATHREDKSLFGAAVARFGNWQNALLAAGIPRKQRERWTKERVVQKLRELAATGYQGPVVHADFNLRHAAARVFGTIGNAIEAAGTPQLTNQWSHQRIIREIKEGFSQGKPLNLQGLGSLKLGNAAIHHFGSWQKAVEAAGLGDRLKIKTPARTWTKEEIIATIQDGHAKGMTSREIARSSPSIERYAKRLFGGWREAYQAAGIESKRRSWTRELVLDEITMRLSTGQSLQSNHPNNINLQAAASRYFGSWINAVELAKKTNQQNKNGGRR
jgi:hypothetical protein